MRTAPITREDLCGVFPAPPVARSRGGRRECPIGHWGLDSSAIHSDPRKTAEETRFLRFPGVGKSEIVARTCFESPRYPCYMNPLGGCEPRILLWWELEYDAALFAPNLEDDFGAIIPA